ncbi:MAG: helix-turn-helix transcriptional regulator [Methanobacteriota archaeon]|nr:MAG: helix-turn-helix transcriptional regulator [Euryarchaeota archaeon]
MKRGSTRGRSSGRSSRRRRSEAWKTSSRESPKRGRARSSWTGCGSRRGRGPCWNRASAPSTRACRPSTRRRSKARTSRTWSGRSSTSRPATESRRNPRSEPVLVSDNSSGNPFNRAPFIRQWMVGKPSVGSAFRRAVGEPVLPEVAPRAPGSSVLLNERRRKVFLTVLDRPGIHLRELARSLDIPLQSLSWHVEILRKAGLLLSTRMGKFAALSVAGQVRMESLKDLALLDIVKNAAIIRVLQRRARTRSQVSGDLKVYPQALDPSLRSLFIRGLIARDPGRVEFEVGPRMQEIIQEFRDSAEEREASLFELLARDGLQPVLLGRDGPKVEIEVNGARKRVKMTAQIVPHVIRVLGK